MNRTVLLLIKLVLSVGLLVYLLQSVDLSDLIRHVIEGQHELFLVAVAVYVTVVLLSTVRWKILLDAAGGDAPYKTLLSSYMVAAFFNNFLPSNVGGDVVRVRDSAKTAGSHTASLTVAFLDRVCGFVALYVIAVTAFALGGDLVQELAGARVILLGLTVLFVTLGVIFMRPGYVSWFVETVGVKRFPWLHGRFETVQATVNAYRARKGALFRAFLVSLVLQLLGVFYFYLVARALRVPLELGASLLMVPLCTLIQAIPVSFNGWGVREGVYVHYFSQVGLPKESALAFSIVGASLVIVLSISGLFVWIARRSHAHAKPPSAES